MGFEPSVNQHLLPPTFPRHTKFLRPYAVVEYWQRLVQRLIAICTLTEHVTTFGTVLVGTNRNSKLEDKISYLSFSFAGFFS